MNCKQFIQHQMLLRTGMTTLVSKTCDFPNEYHIGNDKGHVFVVLYHLNINVIKAQIDVIAQLNQIMNNTSIKRT